MKSACLAGVLICIALTSTVFAQELDYFDFPNPVVIVSPRALGMGGVGVAVADDGAAWHQNPAGLGALNLSPLEGKKLANDVIGSYNDTGDSSFGFTWSGWDPAKKAGFGAGYFEAEDSVRNEGIWENPEDFIDFTSKLQTFGVGYGQALSNSPLSVGVSVLRAKNTLDDAYNGPGDTIMREEVYSANGTIFNVGLLYQVAQRDKAPIRLGLTVNDLTSETVVPLLRANDNSESNEIVPKEIGPFVNFGVAWQATPEWLVAADVTDLTDETDNGPFFSAGAEYSCADTGWKARAGLLDTGDGHDLTLGAGYDFANQFRVDAAWQSADNDDIWSLGLGFSF